MTIAPTMRTTVLNNDRHILDLYCKKGDITATTTLCGIYVILEYERVEFLSDRYWECPKCTEEFWHRRRLLDENTRLPKISLRPKA